MPAAATAGNPLDYTAVIWGEVETLAELVRALGTDPAIDLVLVFYDQPHGMDGAAAEGWAAVREAVMLGAARSPVPTLLSSTLPELLDDDAAWELIRAGVPAVAGLRTGLRCAAAMLGVGRREPDGARLRQIAATARRGPRSEAGCRWLAEHDGKALLREAGVAVADGVVVDSLEAAVAARAALGGTIALKLSAASVQHKSDIGGIALGLASDDDVAAAFGSLAQLALEHGGVVLAERMAASDGLELIVAAHRDGDRARARDRAGRDLDRAARRCLRAAVAGRRGADPRRARRSARRLAAVRRPRASRRRRRRARRIGQIDRRGARGAFTGAGGVQPGARRGARGGRARRVGPARRGLARAREAAR